MTSFKITDITELRHYLVLEGVVESGAIKVGDVLHFHSTPLVVRGIALGLHTAESLTITTDIVRHLRIGDTITE